MFIKIPEGCRKTRGAYEKLKDGEMGKLMGHNDSLRELMKEHPNCIYGIAFVEK